MLEQVADPVPGSQLDRVDGIYPWEKISAWMRSYLLAAAEHLEMWAHNVAPYELPSGGNEIRFRPYLLLARSGLEAAAHTLWLSETPEVAESVRRHLRIMHRDFNLHRQALAAGGYDTGGVEERLTTLERRAAELPFFTRPSDKPPGYEKLVRNAATVTGSDPDTWAYLWNAASGAAHGQNWFGIEAFDLVARSEYEPGYFRAVSRPDPIFITSAVNAADKALSIGTGRWLLNGGHDAVALIREAVADVARRMPRKDI